MSFPYLDLPGIQRRSVVRPSYFAEVEAQSPGFTVQAIASHSSNINARLRKRYGASLPFGAGPPPLLAAGLTPPGVTLQGRPVVGSLLMMIQITTGGALGTAVFKWSSDGGFTWTTGVSTAALVTLGSTGLAAVFSSSGTYDVSNSYAASTPVPEAILKWLTWLVSLDVLERHGLNPNDPFAIARREEAKLARDELAEAANSQTGLFDLPIEEDLQSAITTGGPVFYSETSPFVGQDQEADRGEREDRRGRGTFVGGR